ncbi:UPF0149 family protein [Agrobacterium rosae]|uniref:UPF0149 family protein n=1 Tax=Agrobacterium rosae TaxID=1972867 RepID=A0AAW9FK85_9HYPH|nr:UPF0149 family protein [Agrobacterium rosae]MDX8305839.1 UPF0149 family protein [Agrobacterium rosae]
MRDDGLNDHGGMSTIDGLLAAIVAGPVAMATEVWPPNLFGGTILRAKSGSIEERLVNTVLNRHDEVDHFLANTPGEYYPICET